MKNTIVKLGLSLVAIPGLLFPGLAHAQSCGTWASNIVAQYKSSAPSLGARLATNRSDGLYVSYGVTEEWPLVYVPGHSTGSSRVPPSLQATAPLAQFFSNRMFQMNGVEYPFSPVATDNLGMTIWLGSGGAYSPTLGYAIKPGEVTFTLDSWGDAIVSFIPERCDGMIYGLDGNTGLLVSLFNLPAPPQ